MTHTNGSAATVTIDGNEADVWRLRGTALGQSLPEMRRPRLTAPGAGASFSPQVGGLRTIVAVSGS